MRGNQLRLATSASDRVEVTPGEDGLVTVHLGDETNGLTIVGGRYDVHSLIIEADRQLSRLVDRWQ